MYDWTHLWDEECFIVNPFVVKEPKNSEECAPCVNFEGIIIALSILGLLSPTTYWFQVYLEI